MEDLLIRVLESFGYPVIRQGSLGNNPYPATFFTFFNNDSYTERFYDNQPIATTWHYDVNVYSSNPDLTYSLLLEAKKELKKLGWIVPGKGYDIASDEITHTGRGINALYMEREEF